MPKENEIKTTEAAEIKKVSANEKALVEGEKPCIVSDEMLLGVYGEIMENLRADRTQIDDVLNTFAEMVVNEGDSTTSSKEALVNLLKAKSDTADKMSKVADLMTRIKLKARDTFQPYMAKGNTINIIDQGGDSKRALLETINKAKKKGKK